MIMTQHQRFHLVGIKGVAMTALAQCLVDMGKSVTGSDISQHFVTRGQLERIKLDDISDFSSPLPMDTDCVVYTAAHGADQNPQVIAAREKHISALSHAEALAELFNQKRGIAVCGVGGKSTTSAMLAWILEQSSPGKTSFAVGVGDIIGMNKTGQWSDSGDYFVAEADEYVTDPRALENNQPITPRFSFLYPDITICTNVKYDHPDVYASFDATKAAYTAFFDQIAQDGCLITNADDPELQALVEHTQRRHLTFGSSDTADLKLVSQSSKPGQTNGVLFSNGEEHHLSLRLPGTFNLYNAMAALLGAKAAGVSLSDGIQALRTFSSTQRRSQHIGEKNGVTYYDDYAHHPDEITAVISAFRDWYPSKQLVVAFEPHTFSRTKALLDEFVSALADADQVYLLNIFASAREGADSSISSDLLAERVNQAAGKNLAENLRTIEKLATTLSGLKPGSLVLTLGAGDIYTVHDLIK